jgi:hypothetical protein
MNVDKDILYGHFNFNYEKVICRSNKYLFSFKSPWAIFFTSKDNGNKQLIIKCNFSNKVKMKVGQKLNYVANKRLSIYTFMALKSMIYGPKQ